MPRYLVTANGADQTGQTDQVSLRISASSEAAALELFSAYTIIMAFATEGTPSVTELPDLYYRPILTESQRAQTVTAVYSHVQNVEELAEDEIRSLAVTFERLKPMKVPE